MIYLDYAASTPVDEDVLNRFIDITKNEYANPNSNHDLGISAKKKIDESIENIAELLNVSSDEIIFTSGATESNNLAIRGVAERYKTRGKHILVSSLEHNSIISSCTYLQENGFEVELIPVNKDGLVDIEVLKSMIRDDTILVSVCAVDSEIGLVQPIEEIGEYLKTKENIVFHSDASQAIGKVSINYKDVDLITLAPHKFYGLNGISILVKRKGTSLKPLILGGKSTTVYRSGTPNTALIASTEVALKKALLNVDERNEYIRKLNKKIIDNFNISIKGIKSDVFVAKLNENQVMVSTKTSCCPLNTPSKLVYALTKDKILASTSIRISLSHLTSDEEIDEFLKIFDKCLKEMM